MEPISSGWHMRGYAESDHLSVARCHTFGDARTLTLFGHQILVQRFKSVRLNAVFAAEGVIH
jgi:hypothetical protein